MKTHNRLITLLLSVIPIVALTMYVKDTICLHQIMSNYETYHCN